jgi:hypothetical protein
MEMISFTLKILFIAIILINDTKIAILATSREFSGNYFCRIMHIGFFAVMPGLMSGGNGRPSVARSLSAAIRVAVPGARDVRRVQAI